MVILSIIYCSSICICLLKFLTFVLYWILYPFGLTHILYYLFLYFLFYFIFIIDYATIIMVIIFLVYDNIIFHSLWLIEIILKKIKYFFRKFF